MGIKRSFIVIIEERLYDDRSNQPLKCMAPGCNSDLMNQKGSQRRFRICSHHLNLADIVIGSRTYRYCQQCAQLHPLQQFRKLNRSCDRKLKGRRSSYQKKRQEPASAQQTPGQSPELENPEDLQISNVFEDKGKRKDADRQEPAPSTADTPPITSRGLKSAKRYSEPSLFISSMEQQVDPTQLQSTQMPLVQQQELRRQQQFGSPAQQKPYTAVPNAQIYYQDDNYIDKEARLPTQNSIDSRIPQYTQASTFEKNIQFLDNAWPMFQRFQRQLPAQPTIHSPGDQQQHQQIYNPYVPNMDPADLSYMNYGNPIYGQFHWQYALPPQEIGTGLGPPPAHDSGAGPSTHLNRAPHEPLMQPQTFDYGQREHIGQQRALGQFPDVSPFNQQQSGYTQRQQPVGELEMQPVVCQGSGPVDTAINIGIEQQYMFLQSQQLMGAQAGFQPGQEFGTGPAGALYAQQQPLAQGFYSMGQAQGQVTEQSLSTRPPTYQQYQPRTQNDPESSTGNQQNDGEGKDLHKQNM